MIVKILSGDIISVEGDLESVRQIIKDEHYPEYPLSCIQLLRNYDNCIDYIDYIDYINYIDYFLFVNDKIDLVFNTTVTNILDSRGQGFSLCDIFILRNGHKDVKDDNILASVYVCKNREGDDDCFVLSEDVRVIVPNRIIRTPTKYKTIRQILDVKLLCEQ